MYIGYRSREWSYTILATFCTLYSSVLNEIFDYFTFTHAHNDKHKRKNPPNPISDVGKKTKCWEEIQTNARL